MSKTHRRSKSKQVKEARTRAPVKAYLKSERVQEEETETLSATEPAEPEKRRLVMLRTSQADHLKSWPILIAAVQANAGELLLEDIRQRLEDALEGATTALARQAYFRSLAQQATRDLDEHMVNGKEAAGRVRNGARMRFGLKSEKLAEFGLRPMRPVRVVPTQEEPPEQALTAAQTATPAADSTTPEAIAV